MIEQVLKNPGRRLALIGLLAVLPVEEGKQLKDELQQLENLYRESIRAVDREFVARRDRLLAQYQVAANRLTTKKMGGKG
jgi:hypothetical protein